MAISVEAGVIVIAPKVARVLVVTVRPVVVSAIE